VLLARDGGAARDAGRKSRPAGVLGHETQADQFL
jgi:hypothetical protein